MKGGTTTAILWVFLIIAFLAAAVILHQGEHYAKVWHRSSWVPAIGWV
jgi:hypothetical protein